MTDSTRDPRHLPLAGAHNFRRIEGWRSPDGARIAPGLLYRSSGLQDLTDDDLSVVRSLGISHIVDLRSQDEREREPSRWPEDSSATVWARAESAAAADLRRYISLGISDVEELAARLKGLYGDFPVDLASAVRESLRQMIEKPGAPVMIHCAAGKDRTGFVVAAVLQALGIAEEDIVSDYLMTNQSYDAACRRFSGRLHLAELEKRSPGAMHVLLMAHPHYLDASFDRIARDWGGFDAYLQEMAGIGPEEKEHLRSSFLVERAATKDSFRQ